MKILIVEDEILIQKSLSILLKRRGANVDATASGQRAIEMIKENNYDRIVCDLMLQDITGFDVIEESKAIYTLSDISTKFIIITAYSSEQVILNAKKYNCVIINKPFQDMNSALDTMMDISHE
jgi:CheY-like chemotaxis protein